MDNHLWHGTWFPIPVAVPSKVWFCGPSLCWDCGFESRRGHRYLSLVSVVCCHVDISATGRSLVQRSPTECGVSECDLETSKLRMPSPTSAVKPGKNGVWSTTGMRLCGVEPIYSQRYDLMTRFKLRKQKRTWAMAQAQEHDFITWCLIINKDTSLWRGTWWSSKNLLLVSYVDVCCSAVKVQHRHKEPFYISTVRPY